MTTKRSSSAVRDLRAKFESQDANAEAQAWTSRGRQSSTEGGSRPRIRASFVSVERPGDMDTSTTDVSSRAIEEIDSAPNGVHVNSVPEPGVTTQTSSGVAQNAEIQQNGLAVEKPQTDGPKTSEAPYPSSTAATPEQPAAAEPKAKNSNEPDIPVQENKDTPGANPDKPVSAVEEEPGALRPADPTGASTSSVPAQVSTLNTETVTKKASRSSLANGGPSATAKTSSPEARASKQSTPSKSKAPTSKPSLNFRDNKTLNSPAAKLVSPKSPARPTTSDSKDSEGSHKLATPTKQPAKTGRSSLSAPTASSAAKTKSSAPALTGSETLKPATTDRGLASKAKAKSPTRPVKLPSHLTAPTASSAAKQENTKPTVAGMKAPAFSASTRSSLGDVKPPTNANKVGLSRSKSTATKPAPRSSNAKPVHADEGFLARMMRPTASSASRAHEKTEVKSAPSKTTTLPIRSRPAGDTKSRPPVRSEKAVTNNVPHENGVEKSEEAPSTPAAGRLAESESAPVESTPAQDGPTIVDSSLAGIQTPAGDGPTIR